MLRQRVITALILAGALIATLVFAPYPAQAMLFSLVAAAGAWEWAALVGSKGVLSRVFYAAIILLLCGALWVGLSLNAADAALHARPWLAIAALLWSAMLVGLKYYSAGRGIWGHAWVRALMGWLMLTATWLAVTVCLTLINGPFVVFLLLLTVASADIGAYFAGRHFGQHALAAEISPAKTWEGFWGGMLCVALLATLIWQNLPLSQLHLGWGSLMVLGLATAGASVVGDLTVSLLKREVGLKDSGSLLPGHGGLMDRLDSICGAAPVFALGLLLIGY
jgi:phosphatidate cytidylyltransferase